MPSSKPRGLADTRHPKAFVMIWWPKQMPAIGLHAAWTARTHSSSLAIHSMGSYAPRAEPVMIAASMSSAAGSSPASTS